MPEGLEIRISGDSKQAVASVKQIKDALNQLQAQGKLSLGGLKDAIAQFQQQLLTATSKTEIQSLTRAISVMKDKASELQKSGVDSFSSQFHSLGTGISNTLGPLKQIAYILPGIGIAGLVGGLMDMVTGLFKSTEAFNETDLSAARFDNTLKRVKDSVDDLKNSLDFKEKLANLQLELSGITGPSLSSGQAANSVSKNVELIGGLSTQINNLTAKNENIVKFRAEYEKTLNSIGKTSELARFLSTGGKIEDLTENVVKGLSGADREFVREYQKTNEEIKSLSKQRNDAFQNAILGAAGIGLPFVKPEKLRPQIVKNIKEATRPPLGSIQIELEPILSKKPDLSKIKQSVLKIQDEINKSIDPAVSSKPSFIDSGIKKIQEQFAETAKMAEYVGTTIAGAFGQAFDAVAKGENVFKAVGESIKELVLNLIKAAIESAIVGAIMNAILPGSGGVAGGGFLRRLIGHASGGAVSSNQPIKVGEAGTEIFVPSTSGRIIPNNQIGSLQGSAVPIITFNGNFALSGNQLKLLLNRTDRYQNSNV